MAPPDFARRINYARETLYFFLNGRYSRISSNANNQLTNWIYDGGGNILNTPGGPYDNRFNLENQWTNQNTFHVTYLYDGDGQRVMASGGASGTRIFWYDEAGKVIEEEDGSNVNEYLYVGDQRIARIYNLFSPYYYYSDYLGTSRVSADENGNKCYDADYFPWGDEQQVYVNTCPQNYKFNGKERDPDMGVYDFGARFFQDGIARFYSPDWSATVEPVPYAKLNNPQSLNLYTYVLDNPLSFRDADGHEVGADTLQELQKITSDSGNAAQNQSEPVLMAQNQNPNQSQSSSSSSSGGRVNSPAQGQPPDSTVKIPDGKGGSTDRTFGPDGRAVKDVDTGHDHGAGDPHAHDWDWSKASPRGPGRPLTPEEKQALKRVGEGAAAVGTGYIIYRVVRMAPSVLIPPLWETIPLNAVIP